MVVQDQDGLLGADDLEETDRAELFSASAVPVSGPDHLVGRPLTEIERYYVEKTLEVTAGNREEAAKRLGIGERTLYRIMQDWKLQDKIRKALADARGDLDEASRLLGTKPQTLQRKLKKWGMDT
jgi:two-component system response regulator HydG